VFWSHYSDVEKTPLYPFGFGLSYTKFEYSDLKINKKLFSKGENIQVTFTLKNTGKYDGKEVAQLYIQDEFASVSKTCKRIKGFQIVELKSGESKKITFNLTEKELGFYDNSGNFIVEEGAFKVMVGGNSESVISDEFGLE
jgi:beta-glucosidase